MVAKPNLTLNDRELAEKANVAEAMCKSWLEDLLALRLQRSTPGAIYDFFAGNEELDMTQKAAAEWCDLRRVYGAEMERRTQRSAAARETERQVAAELGAQREANRAEARRIQATDIETPGILATTYESIATGLATTAEGVAGTVSKTVEETTLGYFGRLRENLFGVFGLAQDQTPSERAVGIARMVIASILIYLVYMVASRVLGGGIAVAERGAERTKGMLMELKDMPLSDLGG